MARDEVIKIRLTAGGITVEGWVNASTLQEGLTHYPGILLPGYLRTRLRSYIQLEGHEQEFQPDLELDFDVNPQEARRVLEVAVHAVTANRPSTPTTRENVLKWAEGVVRDHPTRLKEGPPTTEHSQGRVESVPRTVEWVLVNLLKAARWYMCQEWDKVELIEVLVDIYASGVPGFENMSRDVLLDTIESELLENGRFGENIMEEMLDALGFDPNTAEMDWN